MLQSLLLRGVAFLMVLLLVGSMMLLFGLWVSSVIQIGSTIFSSIAEGLSG